MAKKQQSLKFPKDESKHDHGIEWWYWNGHVKDKEGNEYAFMHCLFRTDIRKFNLPVNGIIPHAPFYFSHSVVTDIKRQKAYPKINYAALITKDSFTKKLLHIHYINPIPTMDGIETSITEPELFSYNIRSEQLDIRMAAVKQPILLGNKGFIQLNTDATYYYSLPRLATKGTITIEHKKIPVTGLSWMDHQWANPKFSGDGWTWFSIQLADKTDIVCFRHETKNGTTDYARISHPDGTQADTNNVTIEPIGAPWKSKKTNTNYPVRWRITLPQQHISMTLAARVKDQEMLFGPMHYWEGPVAITATIGKKKTKGLGFAELVGYRSRYSNMKFIETMIAENIKQLI